MVLAAGEGEFDPIPTFTESDKREADATLNDDGGITVSFPAAKDVYKRQAANNIDVFIIDLFNKIK